MASLVLPIFTRGRNLSDPCVGVFIRVVFTTCRSLSSYRYAQT